MAQAQDDGYRYIVHMRDHFTKFSWARAIKQKTADNVAEFLYDTFLMFGPPVILQCDNGKEFSSITKKLGDLWPSLRVIMGDHITLSRQRHYGEKNCRWMETHKQTNWASVLGQIVYTMNCEICRTTRFSPYELVFSVSPDKDRVLLDELFESGVTEEILARDSVDIESNDETESENEGNVL